MSPVVIDSELENIQAEREHTKAFAQKRARYRQRKLHERTASSTDQLAQLCLNLLRIAQHYVPTTPTAFSDFTEVVHCIKTLQKMGITPAITERMRAPVSVAGNEMITTSPDYRNLRNKCIAGFATIADLTEKPAAVGSQEFQRGVREGYRRASDIAVMFLEDINGGDTQC